MTAVTDTSTFATIEDAIEEIRAGRFVVVVDDEDRENEGDLTIAAQFVTPEAVNFMATHARGLICLCLTDERCDELGLRQMTEQNEARHETAFTVSIEAREGVSTGISAADRARTIQVAVDPTSTPHDLVHLQRFDSEARGDFFGDFFGDGADLVLGVHQHRDQGGSLAAGRIVGHHLRESCFEFGGKSHVTGPHLPTRNPCCRATRCCRR